MLLPPMPPVFLKIMRPDDDVIEFTGWDYAIAGLIITVTIAIIAWIGFAAWQL